MKFSEFIRNKFFLGLLLPIIIPMASITLSKFTPPLDPISAIFGYQLFYGGVGYFVFAAGLISIRRRFRPVFFYFLPIFFTPFSIISAAISPTLFSDAEIKLSAALQIGNLVFGVAGAILFGYFYVLLFLTIFVITKNSRLY